MMSGKVLIIAALVSVKSLNFYSYVSLIKKPAWLANKKGTVAVPFWEHSLYSLIFYIKLKEASLHCISDQFRPPSKSQLFLETSLIGLYSLNAEK